MDQGEQRAGLGHGKGGRAWSREGRKDRVIERGRIWYKEREKGGGGGGERERKRGNEIMSNRQTNREAYNIFILLDI